MTKRVGLVLIAAAFALAASGCNSSQKTATADSTAKGTTSTAGAKADNKSKTVNQDVDETGMVSRRDRPADQ